jgi:hypothetical protein
MHALRNSERSRAARRDEAATEGLVVGLAAVACERRPMRR